jgi:hypothetical protein
MNLHTTYNKIESIIKSCNTYEQLKMTRGIINRFERMLEDDEKFFDDHLLQVYSNKRREIMFRDRLRCLKQS